MAQCGRIVRLVPTPHSVRSGAAPMLPLLPGGAEIEFVGPAVPGLLMREPIGFGDGRRFREAVRRDVTGLNPFRRLHAQMDGYAVHAGVDQEMHDVDILGPEFAGHGLGHRAESEFRRRECRKSLAATDAGGRSGEENRTVPPRKHVACGLAADQKPAVTRKLPGLEEQLSGRIQQRLVYVRSGIEETDLDRSDVFFDVGKLLLNFGFLTGIDAERVGVEACGFQLVDQRLRLGCVTPANANCITTLGKTPGDRRADGIACADKYRHAAASRHSWSLPPSSYLIL